MNINPNSVKKFINLIPKTSNLTVDELRNYRNRLLKISDWTQLPDSPLTPEKRAEWAVYRQQLRDITEENIHNVVWPKEPQ